MDWVTEMNVVRERNLTESTRNCSPIFSLERRPFDLRSRGSGDNEIWCFSQNFPDWTCVDVGARGGPRAEKFELENRLIHQSLCVPSLRSRFQCSPGDPPWSPQRPAQNRLLQLLVLELLNFSSRSMVAISLTFGIWKVELVIEVSVNIACLFLV